MKIIATIIITLLFIGAVHDSCEADKWTSEEIQSEVAWEILHLFDWYLSSHKLTNPDDGYYEAGPARLIIGSHPSQGNLNLLMLFAAIAHPLATNWMPREADICDHKMNLRAWWQNTTLGVKGFAVGVGFTLQ